jgi:hypothetical protein
MGEAKRIIGKWLAGGVLSLLAIWAVTAVCTPNIVPERWSEPFQRNVPAEGWSFSHRAESWATTHFGPEGFRNLTDLKVFEGPSAFIWGDSFVEAFQVNDVDKMEAQLNELLGKSGGQEPTFHAVGHSWWSFADYYFRLPLYERIAKDCRLHVIHLFTLQDVLPDQDPRGCISLFNSEPEYHFEEFSAENRGGAIKPEPDDLKESIYRMRLHFFLELKSRSIRIAKLNGLRFSLGPLETGPKDRYRGQGAWQYMLGNMLNTGWATEPPPIEAWTFLLGALKKQTSVPIVFVYAPATPSMDGGRVILENPEQELAGAFAELCEKEGVGFVDLGPDFQALWETEGCLPRGFNTSRPGEGHYNADGHAIVAEAIHRWLKEHSDDLHPN